MSNTIIQLDTFTGTVIIANHTFNVQLALTPREQEIILLTAKRLRFFSYPDSVLRRPNVTITHDTDAHVLRFKSGKLDKSIVWFDPPDRSFKSSPLLLDLQNLMIDIVASKPEYQALLIHW